MRDSRPLVFIGLDSAEPDLLRRWMTSGDLPILASLTRDAFWGNTTTVPGMGNGVLWPTLFTGTNPGRHGRVYIRQLVPGSYRVARFNDDTDYRTRPLWEQASAAGRRCAIVDVVKAPLSPGIHGLQVCDWLSHDRTLPARSTPASLIDDVVRTFGDDPVGESSELFGLDEDGQKRLSDGLLDRIRAKTRYLKTVLADGPWDLVMACYHEPHDAGHMSWHVHDPAYPMHDPRLHNVLGDPIRDVYAAIDRSIGELLADVPDDATVVVFSGPGMGPLYTANHLLEDILKRLDPRGRPPAPRPLDVIRPLYRRLFPQTVRQRLWRVAGPAAAALTEEEWRGRTFFALPNNDENGLIRVNLFGREPNGLVQPGADYRACLETLAQDLTAIVNDATGEPVVERVTFAADHYHGPSMGNLPDLMVTWRRSAPVEAVRSDRIGVIRGRYAGPRTGDHTDRGFFFIRDPAIRSGEAEAPIAVLDLAATIADRLGLDVADLDGRPFSRAA
jgi:predicted AlkP superfamily phosphohydrolase/phosphomutase